MTGSERSRDRVRELFTYWIDNFDAGTLVRCDTPIDAAIRLINWLWVLGCDVLDLDVQIEVLSTQLKREGVV